MMEERGSCTIKDTITVICPKCESVIRIPMHQAVNGEKICCFACRFEFEFRNPA